MVKIDRAYRNISRSDIECDLFFLLVDQQNSLYQQSGELSNVNVKWDRVSLNGGCSRSKVARTSIKLEIGPRYHARTYSCTNFSVNFKLKRSGGNTSLTGIRCCLYKRKVQHRVKDGRICVHELYQDNEGLVERHDRKPTICDESLNFDILLSVI